MFMFPQEKWTRETLRRFCLLTTNSAFIHIPAVSRCNRKAPRYNEQPMFVSVLIYGLIRLKRAKRNVLREKKELRFASDWTVWLSNGRQEAVWVLEKPVLFKSFIYLSAWERFQHAKVKLGNKIIWHDQNFIKCEYYFIWKGDHDNLGWSKL